MPKYSVVVVDRARARMFGLKEADIGEPGPNLVEISDLANPEAEVAGKELWSDNKSGRNASPAGGGAHGYDDHRSAHRKETVQRFAKQVAAEIASVVKKNQSSKLVLVADKHMLGHMREVLNPVTGVQVYEVAKDLTKLSPKELHSYLADAKRLPAREIPYPVS